MKQPITIFLVNLELPIAKNDHFLGWLYLCNFLFFIFCLELAVSMGMGSYDFCLHAIVLWYVKSRCRILLNFWGAGSGTAVRIFWESYLVFYWWATQCQSYIDSNNFNQVSMKLRITKSNFSTYVVRYHGSFIPSPLPTKS